MYYRFFIPLIFNQYEKVLYLDCDLIVNNSFYELFEIEFNNNLLGIVRDNIKHIPGYFNSGVILFNVKEYLKQDVCTKLINYINDNQELQLPDQDALNEICKSQVVYLDRKYNFCPYTLITLDYQTIKELKIRRFNKVNIYHFYQGFKPWTHSNYPYHKKWWQIVKKLPKNIQNLIYEKYKPQKVKLPKIKIWIIHSIFGEKITNYLCKLSKKL